MRAPDFLEHLSMGDDTVRAARQAFQYSMLQGCEMHFLAGWTVRHPVAEIDHGRAEPQNGLRLLVAGGAPHDRLHSCEQLRAAEGLDDVVVRSRLECRDPLLLGRP